MPTSPLNIDDRYYFVLKEIQNKGRTATILPDCGSQGALFKTVNGLWTKL